MGKNHRISAKVGDTVRVEIRQPEASDECPCGRITLEFVPNRGAPPHVELRIMPEEPIKKEPSLYTRLTGAEIFRQAKAEEMYKEGVSTKEINRRLRKEDRNIQNLKKEIEKQKRRD